MIKTELVATLYGRRIVLRPMILFKSYIFDGILSRLNVGFSPQFKYLIRE